MPQLLGPQLRRLLYQLDLKAAAGTTLHQAVATLRNFVSAFKVKVGDIEFALGPAPGQADTGNLEQDLPDLLVAVAEAATERSSAIGLFGDEVQYLSPDQLAALVVACHQVAQRNLPLFFVGAGLPQIAALAGNAKSYAERLFTYPQVGRLDPDFTRLALVAPATAEGAAFEPDAVAEILRVTEGYPYFIQEWGFHIWNAAPASPIRFEDVVAATPGVIAHLDANFFRVRFDRLTTLQQKYLRAMAEHGPGPHKTGDIATTLGVEAAAVATASSSFRRAWYGASDTEKLPLPSRCSTHSSNGRCRHLSCIRRVGVVGNRNPVRIMAPERLAIAQSALESPLQQKDPPMKGKTAIVTGSTSGIGQGIAAALANAGCKIMLNGFGAADEIERTRREMAESYGVEIAYSPADMTKPAEIAGMIEQTARGFGSVDILVNNAGIQHVAPVEAFPDGKWDDVIAINLSAAFHAAKAAIPLMRAGGWGRVINIASAHGLVASAGKAAYVAAKHGLVGLTKVIALENANNGITCNAICPGWVLTPLVQQQIGRRADDNGTSIEEESRKLLSEKQPMHRFTTPEQLGSLAVFLCSDAAGTMTGTTLGMDGGWVAQ